MIIDAKNLIIGRLCTHAAKHALNGEKVDIVNSELAVITGSKKDVLKRHLRKMHRGHPYAGPFFQKRPHFFVKRTVRGMLPYKQARGRAALERVMCHMGIPKKFEGKAETIEAANVAKTRNLKYITVGELTKLLGRKE